jgi:hypothetical protein
MDVRRRGLSGVPQEQLVPGEVQAVLGPGQVQGPAYLAGAVEEILFLIGGQLRQGLAEAVARQKLRALRRLQAPEQHGAGGTGGLGDEIEAVVHTVDEVDIGGAGRGIEGLGPGSPPPAVGVAGLVHRSHVGLGLGDAPSQPETVPAPHQIFAQKRPGGLHGVTVIKIPAQFSHGSTSPFLYLTTLKETIQR